MTVEIRALTDDDRETVHRLRQQAFSARREAFDPDRPREDPRDLVFGAFEADRMVATATAFRLGQWFGGASVPAGAVAGVATSPVTRGGGVGRRLMLHLIGEMREHGFTIATLYPATTSFYRGLGWEVGGTWQHTVSPSRSLAALPAATDVSLRPASFDEIDALRPAYDAIARHRAGWLDRDDAFWAYRRWEFEREEGPQRHLVVAERRDEVVGYVAYRHREEDPRFYGLQVDDLVAPDGGTLAALLRMLGTNRSVTDRVAWRGADVSNLVLLLAEQDVETASTWHWMTRLVDAAGAIAARSYLPGVTAAVDLDVRDEHADWNAGRRRLVVDGGEGRLEEGGDGRVRVDIGALSALFTGWASPWELARLGRLDGATEDDLAGLAAAFSGPRPWLPDFF